MPMQVEVQSVKTNLIHPNNITEKMNLIMESANQIEHFIDGQTVSSSATSEPVEQEEPLDNVDMEEELDDNLIIKDFKSVTGK